VVVFNNDVYGNTNTEQVVKLLKGFEQEGEYTGFEYD
jgi:hypothetical protein